MSTLRRREPEQSIEDRAVLARQDWWTKTTHRAGITLVDSAFRFAVAEINLEKLPVVKPEEIRQRAERLLLEMRSQGLIVRSADEVRFFYTHARRELDLARLAAGKYPPRPGSATQPPAADISSGNSQEAIGSLVARLLTQPGLDALSRLAETLSTMGASAPFKADHLALEAIDPVNQTITLSISDAAEFQKICSALRQAEPSWGTSPSIDEGPSP